MSRLTDINLSILADIDKPADWELEDYVGFSQEAAREILELREKVARLEGYCLGHKDRNAKLEELLRSFVDNDDKTCPGCDYTEIPTKGHQDNCPLAAVLDPK